MDAKIKFNDVDLKNVTVLDPIRPNIIVAGSGGGGEDNPDFEVLFDVPYLTSGDPGEFDLMISEVIN